jgi:pyruvate formate lyase activating enzyme
VNDPQPRFFSFPKEKNRQTLRCELCPRFCQIPPGGFGQCRVRSNREGRGALPFYGFITALAEDPIEKKPLYHYRPGSAILSLGFAGCNLRCPFCQNWHISQTTDVQGSRFSPEEIIALVQEKGFTQIAYTYSEPLVHIEFLLDCMALARKAGIANVLVSNGCVTSDAAAEILALTDAANIDLKCFSEETYSRLLGGSLPAVLAFIETACKTGVHLEVTTLIVPGLNDGEEETRRCAAFLAGLSPAGSGMGTIPWHLSAYHPDYQWEAPPTDPARLREIARRAREKLAFVYTGNVPGETTDRFTDTRCPHCGAVLVQRRGYRVNTGGLVLKEESGRGAYYCAHCGKAAPIRW